MEKDVNMLLATYGKYFPESSLMQIREIFENMDEKQIGMLVCLQFKDPITVLIISLFGGVLGIDRFYLGHKAAYLRWILHLGDHRPLPRYGFGAPRKLAKADAHSLS